MWGTTIDPFPGYIQANLGLLRFINFVYIHFTWIHHSFRPVPIWKLMHKKWYKDKDSSPFIELDEHLNLLSRISDLPTIQFIVTNKSFNFDLNPWYSILSNSKDRGITTCQDTFKENDTDSSLIEFQLTVVACLSH